MIDVVRRAQIYALWNSSLEWLPPIRSSLDPRQAGVRAGFTDGRRTMCERCRATGRVRGEGVDAHACQQCVSAKLKAYELGIDYRPSPMHGCRMCIVCDGTGHRLRRRGELGVDEYRRQSKTGQLDDANLRHDRALALDRQISALHRDLAIAEGEDDPDWWLSYAIREKERLWRNGSYAELEGQMRVLKIANPLAWQLVMRVEVYLEPIHVSERTRQLIDTTADWVAERMPQPIEVPAEYTPAAVNEARKGMLWHGSNRRANPLIEQRRRERAARVVHASEVWGWSAEQIATHEALSARRVRQLLAERRASAGVDAAVATGPAA